ncbi:MAG: hypothetical protein GY791_11280 [Alphaproteobacteria bacterium]|nr:hypothetical protein [Alphaproteobacteria bacterium]
MDRLPRDLTIAFAAGALGALANSLTAWAFGELGITGALGVRISPTLSPQWFYQRLVWGGIWGFLLVLPFLRANWPLRGLVFSIAPSLALLLIVLPIKTQAGVGGFGLGALTPVFVFFFNAVWGLVAAWWFRAMTAPATVADTR